MMGRQSGRKEVVTVRALRVRFAARWIGAALIALIVVALVVQTARFARRPYPRGWMTSAAYYVFWSDDTVTVVNDGPRSLEMREFGPVMLVRWPDGQYSLYLQSGRALLPGRSR